MEFSKKLYELRKKNGLSQEEMANKLNVTRQTISKWELGESTPDMEKLIILSDYFNISLDELVLGKVPKQSENNAKSTAVQIVDERILTKENKNKMKKGLKIAAIIFVILLTVDLLSMIICFIVNGIPG